MIHSGLYFFIAISTRKKSKSNIPLHYLIIPLHFPITTFKILLSDIKKRVSRKERSVKIESAKKNYIILFINPFN